MLFKKFTNYFYFMCMDPWCPWKPDEGTGATDSCEPTCRFLKTNIGPLKELSVLFNR